MWQLPPDWVGSNYNLALGTHRTRSADDVVRIGNAGTRQGLLGGALAVFVQLASPPSAGCALATWEPVTDAGDVFRLLTWRWDGAAWAPASEFGRLVSFVAIGPSHMRNRA